MRPFSKRHPYQILYKILPPQPSRFHYPHNTSLFILQSLQLFEMQRACVKILLSYLAVLNIFLSALTCTQYAYRLPFTSLHNKEEMFPASKNWIWTQNPSHGS